MTTATKTEPLSVEDETELTTALVRKVGDLVGKAKTFSYGDLLAAVVETRHEDKGAVVEVGRETPLPKPHVGVPREVAEDAVQLLADLDALELPTTHRELTKRELRDLVRLYPRLDKLVKALSDAQASAKVATHNHFNARLEREGLVGTETETDSGGNYAVKADTAAELPEESVKMTRGYTRPSLEVDPDVLLDLKQQGKITTTVYNRITRQARVVDEHGFNSVIARDPSLMDVLADAIVEKNAPKAPISYARNTTAKGSKKG